MIWHNIIYNNPPKTSTMVTEANPFLDELGNSKILSCTCFSAIVVVYHQSNAVLLLADDLADCGWVLLVLLMHVFSKICFMPKWKHCPTLLGITMMKPWNFLFHIFDSNGSNFDTHIGTQSHLTFMTLVMVELKFIDDTQHQWSKLCKWIKSFGDWKGFDLERFSS